MSRKYSCETVKMINPDGDRKDVVIHVSKRLEKEGWKFAKKQQEPISTDGG